MKACYYGDTNVGLVRSGNEDAFVIQRVGQGPWLLAMVVDGVGGEAGGAIAANIACRCIREHIESIDSDNSAEVLQAAVVYANNSIYEQHCYPIFRHMSCVLSVALLNTETGRMDICHIGDTRIYMLKGGSFDKLTVDHSMVGYMEEAGRLSELEAMAHPRRNQISRSVGSEPLYLGTDYIYSRVLMLEPPCTLLLCSDGLYDMVPSLSIVPILEESTSPEGRVRGLIEAALAAGGKDNVTAIVIDITE